MLLKLQQTGRQYQAIAEAQLAQSQVPFGCHAKVCPWSHWSNDLPGKQDSTTLFRKQFTLKHIIVQKGPTHCENPFCKKVSLETFLQNGHDLTIQKSDGSAWTATITSKFHFTKKVSHLWKLFWKVEMRFWFQNPNFGGINISQQNSASTSHSSNLQKNVCFFAKWR